MKDTVLRAKTSLLMLQNATRDCVRTMEILNSEHRSAIATWRSPFYILAATALELSAKVVIWKQRFSKLTLPQAQDNLKKFRHDLSILYSSEGVGDKFLEETGIVRVEKVQDREMYVFNYAFYLHNDLENPIYVYDVESLRYGIMTESKPNAGYVAWQTDQLFDLCKKVWDVEAKQYFK